MNLQIIDKPIQHFSVSQIGTFRNCPRRWFYSQFTDAGREPPSPASKLGNDIHDALEGYLNTGIVPVGRLTKYVTAAQEYLPSAPIDPTIQTAEREFRREMIPGVTLLGYIDFEDQSDPNEIQILDFKTTSDIQRNSKKIQDMFDDPQLIGYAWEAINRYPKAKRVKLTLLYLQTRGDVDARPKEIILSKEEILSKFKSLQDTAELMQAVHDSKPQNVLDVPPDFNQCKSYGKDCYYKKYCSDFPKTEEERKMSTESKLSKLKNTKNALLAAKGVLPPDAPTRMTSPVQETIPVQETLPEPVEEQIEAPTATTVYIDCIPIDEMTVDVQEWALSYKKEVEKELGVPDFRLAAYGAGKGALIARLRDALKDIKDNLRVSSRSDIGQLFIEASAGANLRLVKGIF